MLQKHWQQYVAVNIWRVSLLFELFLDTLFLKTKEIEDFWKKNTLMNFYKKKFADSELLKQVGFDDSLKCWLIDRPIFILHLRGSNYGAFILDESSLPSQEFTLIPSFL